MTGFDNIFVKNTCISDRFLYCVDIHSHSHLSYIYSNENGSNNNAVKSYPTNQARDESGRGGRGEDRRVKGEREAKGERYMVEREAEAQGEVEVDVIGRKERWG